MPTIFAAPGTTGWRIFAKPIHKRLRPSALITLHDVDLAVDETRRAITELGAIGLCLVPEPANGSHIHDRYYDPVWREAEKLGVPVCFHPAANPNTDQVVHRFKGHNNEAVLINAFRNPVELMLAVGSFCAGGVLERFPSFGLRFSKGIAVGCPGRYTGWTNAGRCARITATNR